MKRKLAETRSEPTAVISKSGVQSLIQNEVRRAVKLTEAKMESLLEKVQRLECEPKDDLRIRKLEVHIKKVKRRGEASMAFVRKLGPNVPQTSDPQNQIPLSSSLSSSSIMSGTVDLSRSDSVEDVVEVTTPSLETKSRKSISQEIQVHHPSLLKVKLERMHPGEPSPPAPVSTLHRLFIKEEALPESIAAENIRRELVKPEGLMSFWSPVGTPSPAESGHSSSSSSSTSTLPAPTGTARINATAEGSNATAQTSKDTEVEPPSGARAGKEPHRTMGINVLHRSDSPRPVSLVKLDRKRPRDPSPSSSPERLYIKEEVLSQSIAAEHVQRELVPPEALMSEGRPVSSPSPAESGHSSSSTSSSASSTSNTSSSSSSSSSSTSTLPAPTGSARTNATVEDSNAPAQRLSAFSQDEGEPDLPPLPATAFPSVLPAAAASFSIPVKVELSLAYIQNPPQITVMWDSAEKDTAAPPMESYSVYMTLERTRGSGVYTPWKMISEVRALDLPMVILIKRGESMSRRRLCFAVVGKDEFGRFGPYSDVKHAVLPN